jgi:hypothetical protein
MTTCQQEADAGLYAQALAGFVRWLTPRYGTIVERLHTEIAGLRHQALQGGHRRTPEMMANLALGMQYFLAYAHDRGALHGATCQALWARAWKALGAVAAAQHEYQRSEEPVSRFLALLAGALAAGQAHVADASTLRNPTCTPEHWGWRAHTLGTGASQREEWYALGERVGWVQGARLYLEPEAAFSVVQKLAETQKASVAITQRTLWKRMREQGMLASEPSQAQNTVRRDIGPDKKRTRVIDLPLALLASEISPNSPQTNNTSKINGSYGDFPDCFPMWYGHKQSAETVHNCAEPSLVDLGRKQENVRTDVGTDAARQTVPHNAPQPLENTEAGLNGLNGLKTPAYPSPQRTPACVSLPTVGDWVWLVSADDVQQNAMPYQIMDIRRGPNGQEYAHFAETATRWLLTQCKRITPPEAPSPLSPDRLPRQMLLTAPPPEAPPMAAIDDLGGTSALTSLRHANPCPQCGCGQWLLGVTARLCAACGYKDSAGREALR